MKKLLKGVNHIEIKAIRGKDGLTPTDEQLEKLIKPLIPEPVKGDTGERGQDGSPGKDGKEGKKGEAGKPGKDGVNGTNGLNGKDGSPDTPDEVVDKIHESKKLIDPKKIKGLSEALGVVDKFGTNPIGNVGGADPLIFQSGGDKIGDYVTKLNVTGSGGTLSYSGDGVATLNLSAGGSETFESVSKNLKSYPYELSYTGDNLTSIVYDLGGGQSITKTLSYTGDNLTSIVLSGDIPAIDTTKTLVYTGDNLTDITYS